MSRKTRLDPDMRAASGYVLALGAVSTALAVRLMLIGLLAYQGPFLPFVLAVMITATFGGRGPGLLATTISLLAVWYFFLPIANSFVLKNPADVMNLVTFFVVGSGITLLSDRMREALRVATRTEETNRALLESASQGIVSTSGDGRIINVNAMAERMFGYTREELIGKPLVTLLPETRQTARAATAAGSEVQHTHLLMDRVGQRRDGSSFPVEVNLSSAHTADGTASIAFVTDISERKQAEEAMRNQANMLNLAHDPIFAWQPGGRIYYWNRGATALYGFTPEEAMGRISHELLKSVLPFPEKELESRLEAEGSWIGEIVHTAKDGSSVIVESRMILYTGPKGDRTVLETNRDITGRKAAAEEIRLLNEDLERRVRVRTAELQAANTELEAFAYSVSHDLRAPLRGIDGWSMALLEDYEGQLDERALGYLHRVRGEAQRLGGLIDDLLQLSRVTRMQIRSQAVDVSALAGQLADRLRELHPGRRLQFTIQPSLSAKGDPRLVEVVLTNLLENAVKFTGTRPEGVIEVGGSEDGAARIFFVRDNGVGFDMAYASSLFGVFQRLHKASEFPGTGIGLATVQRIVHRHGGRTWAESADGQGATFYFALPV